MRFLVENYSTVKSISILSYTLEARRDEALTASDIQVDKKNMFREKEKAKPFWHEHYACLKIFNVSEHRHIQQSMFFYTKAQRKQKTATKAYN